MAAAVLAVLVGLLWTARAEATTIVDTFDTDAEGWLVTGNPAYDTAVPATWNATGGNPDGYISAVDDYDDNCGDGGDPPCAFVQFVNNGSPWADDHSENYGGLLEFDAMVSAPPTYSVYLYLIGAGDCALRQPGQPGDGSWGTFSVPLTEADWTACDSPEPMDEARFRSILASVVAVVIDSDAVDGTGETIGLDNVALREPDVPDLFESTLTLKYRGGKFRGQLGSSSPECIGDVKVQVFKRKKGPDRKLGSPRTGDDGKYSLKKPRRKGKYYSKVAERVVAGGICGAKRSKVLTLN